MHHKVCQSFEFFVKKSSWLFLLKKFRLIAKSLWCKQYDNLLICFMNFWNVSGLMGHAVLPKWLLNYQCIPCKKHKLKTQKFRYSCSHLSFILQFCCLQVNEVVPSLMLICSRKEKYFFFIWFCLRRTISLLK